MLKRKPINKFKGARKFNKQSAKTHPRNIATRPQRGGFRL